MEIKFVELFFVVEFFNVAKKIQIFNQRSFLKKSHFSSLKKLINGFFGTQPKSRIVKILTIFLIKLK